MSGERITLADFLCDFATAIKARVECLNPDEAQLVHVLMFDCICAAHERDAREVERITSEVRPSSDMETYTPSSLPAFR